MEEDCFVDLRESSGFLENSSRSSIERGKSSRENTGFAAELNISKPKELVRNITSVTVFIPHTERSHLE